MLLYLCGEVCRQYFIPEGDKVSRSLLRPWHRYSHAWQIVDQNSCLWQISSIPFSLTSQVHSSAPGVGEGRKTRSINKMLEKKKKRVLK